MIDHAASLTGRRVLVVEDEYLIASQMKRWLAAAGAVVVGPVPSTDQAFDLIDDGSLDAGVLDINLGDGHTAYPVAEKLERMGVPYLFATGDVTTSEVSMYRYRPRIEKPFGEVGLVRALTRLLS